MGEEYKVYKIVNKITGKIYIGVTSKKLKYRFRSHIKRFESGQTSYKLYNSMRKHRTENFYIEKICDCLSKEEMFEKEKELIEEYNSIKEGYNMNEGGNAPPSMKGRKRPDVSQRLKENNPMSDENIRERHKDATIRNEEWKRNNEKAIRKANSEESNRKQAKSISGDNNPNKRKDVKEKKAKKYVITDPEGNEYKISNLSEFCQNKGLNHSNMTLVAQGKRKQHKGWTCQYDY